MITILYPCLREQVGISDDWEAHLKRPGYNRNYAGTDFYRKVNSPVALRGSQFNGVVTQSMWSTQGYGYTTFVDYLDMVKIRNAHQKDLGVKVGDIIEPTTYLGTMNSTGNSTGDHTHFEVWLKRNGVWQNVDPLNPINEVMLVNSVDELVPFGDEIPPMDTIFPELPELPKVKTNALITRWVNLRALPTINSKDLGDVRPGVVCTMVGHKIDYVGNHWIAVMLPDNKVGWVAGVYHGEKWFDVIVP